MSAKASIQITGSVTERTFTVTELAAELGVTTRTLRFYEDKGLVTPRRLGTTRAYTTRDRARMMLILRGKRLGFSLRDIAKYLDLYRADATGAEQLQSLLSTVGARIAQLGQQRDALAQTLDELHEIQHQATERLMARKAS